MTKRRPISKTTQETIKTAFKLLQENYIAYAEGEGSFKLYQMFLQELNNIPDYIYSTYYSSVRNVIKVVCEFNQHNGTDLETTLKQIDNILNILIKKEV